MGRGPEDSAAPATASLAATQQQKPKTVSDGGWRPAGWRARGDNAVKTHQDRHGWRRGRRFLRPWSQHQHPRQVSHQQSSGGAPASSSTAQASSAQGGRRARERVPGDAPVRRLAAAQRDARTLGATPHSTPLPPLVSTGPRSYLPNRGLPGVEPEQPNPPKKTASAAGPTLPPRCRSRPATLAPPQDAYQL